VKRLLAKVSGAPLFHEVALNNGDVVFFFHVILSANTLFCVAARVDQGSRQIETQAFDLQREIGNNPRFVQYTYCNQPYCVAPVSIRVPVMAYSIREGIARSLSKLPPISLPRTQKGTVILVRKVHPVPFLFHLLVKDI
jgi:hypothetical protein